MPGRSRPPRLLKQLREGKHSLACLNNLLRSKEYTQNDQMGCGSSSLKGSEPQRSDLNDQADRAPRIVVQEVEDPTHGPMKRPSAVAPSSEISNGKQRKSTGSSLPFNKASFSLSNPRPNPKPLSDEEFQKATGMTRDELQAWGDKNILRGSGTASKAEAGLSPLSGVGFQGMGLGNY